MKTFIDVYRMFVLQRFTLKNICILNQLFRLRRRVETGGTFCCIFVFMCFGNWSRKEKQILSDRFRPELYFRSKVKQKQAQRRASAQKSRGNSVRGRIFPHDAQNGFPLFSSFQLRKKSTKLIYHMPWLYQYLPLPFHRSYKNQSNILKIAPLGSRGY